MPKRMSPVLTVSIIMSFFFCVAHAQVAGKAWEKTVTVLSGEVILDMSGEWDVFYEHYGFLRAAGDYKDILTITQEGNKFVAVKQIGSEFVPKGAETIRGELQSDGFKTIQMFIGRTGWTDCKAKISENGNKIVLDNGESSKATLTRK
jgi:hypothetical protein